MKKTIYLAGPFLGCEDEEIYGWRQTIKSKLSEKYDFLDPANRIGKGMSDEEIVEGDKRDIYLSDILLVNHTKPSDGTAMEILFAWDYDVNIITITNDHEVSPWIKYHSTNLFKSIDEVISYLIVKK